MHSRPDGAGATTHGGLLKALSPFDGGVSDQPGFGRAVRDELQPAEQAQLANELRESVKTLRELEATREAWQRSVSEQLLGHRAALEQTCARTTQAVERACRLEALLGQLLDSIQDNGAQTLASLFSENAEQTAPDNCAVTEHMMQSINTNIRRLHCDHVKKIEQMLEARFPKNEGAGEKLTVNYAERRSSGGFIVTEHVRPPVDHGLAQAREMLMLDFQRFRGWGKSDGVAATSSGIEGLRIHSLQYINWIGILLVVCNLAFMGIRAQISFNQALLQQEAPPWLNTVEIIMCIFFWLEMSARIIIERKAFVTGENRMWNVFDCILNVSFLGEVFLDKASFSWMRAFRAVRAIRAARLLQTLSYFRALRLMLVAIFSSSMSLLWVLILQFAQDILEENPDSQHREALLNFYGSLWRTMLSLSESVSGGRDWAVLVEPLMASSWSGLIYAVYVAFMTVGVANVLSAIFVDTVFDISVLDRELTAKSNMSHKHSKINSLKQHILNDGADSSGVISKARLGALLQEEKTRHTIEGLGLTPSMAEGLVALLNLDNDGVVSVEEFICSLSRIASGNMHVDVGTLMYECKRILLSVSMLTRAVDEGFGELWDYLGVQT